MLNARVPWSSSRHLLLTRSRGWSASVVARGPSFFSLLLRNAGGWIVSRLLNTAWMEGMLTPRRRPGACCVCGGAASLALAAALPVLPPRVCHSVAATLPKGANHTARGPARPKTSTALGSPGWVKPPALNKLGGGTPPAVWSQARLARLAPARPRGTSPSSGGTSLPESRPSWALEARRARHRERWSSGCREAAIYTLRSEKLPLNKQLEP